MALADRTLDAVADRLRAAGCVAAREEAAELVGAAPDAATLERWVRRRERGEPPAWITGSVVFGGRRLRVDPGVYVPRVQTEDLARRAAARLPAGGRAVDLCTGSGAVAAHLRAEVPGALVVGVDVDPRAAACARANGVPAVVADLAGPVDPAELPGGTGQVAGTAAGTAAGTDGGAVPLRPGAVDVVMAVPPYVPTGAVRLLPTDVQRWEPRRAVDGGADGLDVARLVVAAAGRLLRPGGWLLVELGGEEDRALAPALAAAGFAPGTPWADADGDLRGLAARRTGA